MMLPSKTKLSNCLNLLELIHKLTDVVMNFEFTHIDLFYKS